MLILFRAVVFILGQTWALTILRFIRQAQDLEDGKDISLADFYQQIPFIEAEYSNGKTGVDVFNKLSPPRCIKTHLPYPLWKRQLEEHPNLRIIQTIRNPKDALVSYYHHCRSDGQLGGFHGTWDQFFEIFKEGKLPWGDFFKHNAEWYRFNTTRENSLILRFEEMKQDPRAHVVKIAKFAGYDLCDKTIDLIVEKSSIQQVSEKFRPIQESNASWNGTRSNFIRKGEVGDWVNYFLKEQSDYIDTKCKEYLEPLGILF